MTEKSKSRLTHLDDHGNASMVDVSDKAVTARFARAKGRISISHALLDLIKQGLVKKGDVLSIARLAGIMGAKKTAELIPLCHPIPLTSVKIELELQESPPAVQIYAQCKTTDKTGIEMEALTAVSVAALTIYDMGKAIDRSMVIGDICLVEKSGGASGHYQRDGQISDSLSVQAK